MSKSILAAFLVPLFFACSFAHAQVDFAGYWKLDDDKNSKSVADETGTSDGIVHGKVKLKKNGVNDNSDSAGIEANGAYIEIPHHSDYLLHQGTVTFWIYPKKLSGRQGLFSKDSNSYDTGGHLSIYLDGDHLKARLQSKTTTYELKSKSNLKKETWHHIAFVFGPGGMELYINGQLEKTNSYQGGLGSNSGGTGNFEPLVLGGLSWLSGNKIATPVKDHFHGHIDEVAILSNRLNSSTVADIYTQTGENGQYSLSDFSNPPPVYYVRKDGSNSNDGLSPDNAFKTIQHAVTKCSQPGITVYVGPGTYTEEIDIGDNGNGKGSVTGTQSLPIRLIADTTGEFTLDSPGPVILDGNNHTNKGFDIKQVEHWVIQGFTIDNQTEYAIYVDRGGVSILNCTIKVPRRYGIFARSAGSITIADNVFERDYNSAHIIWVQPTTNLTSTPAKIIVTRNDMTMKGKLYLSTGFQNGWSAFRNRPRHARYIYGVIVMTQGLALIDDIQITNNQVSDTFLPLYAMSNTRVPVQKITMANNTIVGSFYSTYTYSRSRSDIVVINNIIDTCYFGTLVFTSRSNSTVISNILEQDITFSMVRFRRPFENKILTGNPMFIDAPTGDFSLAMGSPAIDAGISLYAPTTDIAGLDRPTDGDNDGIALFDLGVTEIINTGAPTKIKVVQWREISGHRDMSQD